VNVYRLGCLEGQMSMLIFHALARMGSEGLIIVSPKERIVSIGYFQDTDKVVDLEYCKTHGISVMRREIGGGTTLLDQDQIFFQLLLRRDNPGFPRGISALYELIAGPCVDTYRQLGVRALFRPVNDVITEEGRKVSGLGGADIGECVVFVGNIILNFDSRGMANILKVPSEKFRDKVFKSLEDNVSSVLKETGKMPPRKEVEDLLIENFEKSLGKLNEVPLPAEVYEKARELGTKMMSDEFLFKRRDKKTDGKSYMKVKISSDVQVSEQSYKAPGGLITVTCAVEGGIIRDISITGDFTLYPKERLRDIEDSLIGVRRHVSDIEEVISKVYRDLSIDSPGVLPLHFAEAICKAS
jgi:lipoate-protein ligase A